MRDSDSVESITCNRIFQSKKVSDKYKSIYFREHLLANPVGNAFYPGQCAARTGQAGGNMNVLSHISDIIIPLLLFYIIGYGLVSKVKVYEAFLTGAKEGLKVVVDIMPTLVGLLVAVGILRASGFLDFLSGLLAPLAEPMGIPAAVVPVILVKLFSGSAATGLVLDVFRTYGPDSYIGMLVSILMSCTETCFYTMSVYYLAAKVTKTRYTLPGALLSLAASAVMSLILARGMG